MDVIRFGLVFILSCIYILFISAVVVVMFIPLIYNRQQNTSVTHDSGSAPDAPGFAVPNGDAAAAPGAHNELVGADKIRDADPSAPYRHLKRNARDWHDYAQMENDKKRTGPGEQGQSVKVPTSMKDLQLELYRVCVDRFSHKELFTG
jgi:hypothetical protein